MGNFNRGRSSGRPGGRSSGRPGARGSDRRDPARSNYGTQMHEVICDECGKSCEVPFKPTGGKPVYCSDCFRNKDGGESRGPRRESRSGSSRGEARPSAELKQINEKLDRILEMLSE